MMTGSIPAMWSLCWKALMKSRAFDTSGRKDRRFLNFPGLVMLSKSCSKAEPSVKKKAEADGIVPGRAVKFDLTFSKPTTKA
jgi:hypothetical protein